MDGSGVMVNEVDWIGYLPMCCFTSLDGWLSRSYLLHAVVRTGQGVPKLACKCRMRNVKCQRSIKKNLNPFYQKLPGIDMRSGISASFSFSLPPSVRMTTDTHAAYASRIAHAMHVSLMFATIAVCP